MRPISLLCLAAGLLLAGDPAGLRPRGNPADYPAHAKTKGVELGAAAIAPEQVAKLFATDLNRGGYIVLEVALYPEPGSPLDVKSGDFLLSAGSSTATVRAVNSHTIAGALQRKNTPKPRSPGDIDIYPTATVGYETGSTYPNGQRRSGVYTATGVAVGIGDPGPAPPRPGSTGVDRDTMQQELQDKGLPEAKTSDPVAGYLYFPRPASAKGSRPTWHLTYYGAEGQVVLTIPPPAGKR